MSNSQLQGQHNDSLYQGQQSYLNRQSINNSRILVHPKITTLPQPPQSLINKQRALMMNDILSPQRVNHNFSKQQDDETKFLSSEGKPSPYQIGLKLPEIFTPSKKLHRSKQFYNYIQEQMAIEYGIDINNGIILKKLKNTQMKRDSSLPNLSQTRKSKHIVDQIPQNLRKMRLQTDGNTSLENSVVQSVAKIQFGNSHSRNNKHQLENKSSLRGSSIYKSGFNIVKENNKRYEEAKNASLEKQFKQQEQIICKNSFSYKPAILRSSNSLQDLSFMKQVNQKKGGMDYYNSQRHLVEMKRDIQNQGTSSFSNLTLKDLMSAMKE